MVKKDRVGAATVFADICHKFSLESFRIFFWSIFTANFTKNNKILQYNDEKTFEIAPLDEEARDQTLGLGWDLDGVIGELERILVVHDVGVRSHERIRVKGRVSRDHFIQHHSHGPKIALLPIQTPRRLATGALPGKYNPASRPPCRNAPFRPVWANGKKKEKQTNKLKMSPHKKTTYRCGIMWRHELSAGSFFHVGKKRSLIDNVLDPFAYTSQSRLILDGHVRPTACYPVSRRCNEARENEDGASVNGELTVANLSGACASENGRDIFDQKNWKKNSFPFWFFL